MRDKHTIIATVSRRVYSKVYGLRSNFPIRSNTIERPVLARIIRTK
jgi:hypothetical protein